jgi:type IV pilus assembly protein PilB
MKGLKITDDELRTLLVTDLEVITKAEFDSAQSLARRFRTTVGRILVERGHVPQGFLLGQLAQIWGVGYIDLKASDVNQQALQLVDEEFARNKQIVPFDLQNNHLKLAMCDPRDRQTIDQIQKKTGHEPVPHLAPGPAIHRAHLLYKSDLRQMLNRAAMDKTLILTGAARSDGKDVGHPHRAL